MVTFFKQHRAKFLAVMMLIAAVVLSSSAAVFSVTGLAAIFGGSVAVVILAATIEISKVISVISYHVYHKYLSRLNQFYLVFAVVITMIITSIGIFGFLSAHYETARIHRDLSNEKIALYENKLYAFESQKEALNKSIENMEKSRENFTRQLNDLQNSYARRGWKTDLQSIQLTTNSLNRIQNQLEEMYRKRSAIEDSILAYQVKVQEVQLQTVDVRTKLSPLEYAVRIIGIPEDKAVMMIIVFLMFLIDPLALMFFTIFVKVMYEDELSEDNSKFEQTNVGSHDSEIFDESDFFNLIQDDLEDLPINVSENEEDKLIEKLVENVYGELVDELNKKKYIRTEDGGVKKIG